MFGLSKVIAYTYQDFISFGGYSKDFQLFRVKSKFRPYKIHLCRIRQIQFGGNILVDIIL